MRRFPEKIPVAVTVEAVRFLAPPPGAIVAPPPRRVRWRWHQHASRLLAAFMCLGMPLTGIWRIYIDDARMTALNSRGRIIIGEVIGKQVYRDEAEVHYQFVVEDVPYKSFIVLPIECAGGMEQGSLIAVTYLPNEPGTNFAGPVEGVRDKQAEAHRFLRKSNIFLFVVFGAVWMYAETKGHAAMLLARNGVGAEAEVTRVRQFGPIFNLGIICHQFQAHDGNTHVGKTFVRAPLARGVGVGAPIYVLYDPSQPSRNASLFAMRFFRFG